MSKEIALPMLDEFENIILGEEMHNMNEIKEINIVYEDGITLNFEGKNIEWVENIWGQCGLEKVNIEAKNPVRDEYSIDKIIRKALIKSLNEESPRTIKSITLNDKKKITTVVFTDGDTKMVKCGENDTYSPEMGIVYCMALKYSGLSKTQFKKMIDGFIPKEK